MKVSSIEHLKINPIVSNDNCSIEDKINRTVILYVFMLLGISVLFYRLVFLQAVRGGYFRLLSDENRIKTKVVAAYRGIIKDRNDKVLVRNVPSFSVKVRKDSSSLQSDLAYLSKYVNVSDAVSVDDFLVFYGVDRDTAIKMQPNMPSSLVMETEPMRQYLYPYQFAHVLGYVSSIPEDVLSGKEQEGYMPYDKIGVTGVEKLFEAALKGRDGSSLYESNVQGQMLREISSISPVNGGDVKLTIDGDLQIKSYEVLEKAIKKSGATGAALVAQDPNSGEVLALVSYPSFDPNIFAKGNSSDYDLLLNNPQKPLFDRVLMGQYPPGSVFKIVAASALLEGGVVSEDTKIEAPGSISIGSFVYKDWEASGHGELNIVRALAESADTFFYKAVGGYADFKGSLGPERLSLWARKFGFGEISGINLDYEEPGLIPDPVWKAEVKNEPWYLGDSYITAIGQGDVLATPLQVNQAMSVIANGGYVIKPILRLGENRTNVPKDKIISDKTATLVKEGLREACLPHGTAYPFFDFEDKHPGIFVGCKTGTSEFGEKNLYGEYKTHAWFSVFAPFDKPQIVLTVFLEGGGGGAEDAAPPAREILDWYFGGRQ